MKRRTVRLLAWVGVALCVVALAFGLADRVFGPPLGVTQANAVRVQSGMTLAEVEAIFGCPANGRVDFTRVMHGDPPNGGWQGPDPTLGWVREWVGRRGAATVAFERDEVVLWARFEVGGRGNILEQLGTWRRR